MALLAAIPIFAPLSEAVLEHLASALEPLELAAGTTVFSEGDHGDGFYVVERGEVEVLIAGARIRTLGPGESFGEIALLRDVPAPRRSLSRRHAAPSARSGALHTAESRFPRLPAAEEGEQQS